MANSPDLADNHSLRATCTTTLRKMAEHSNTLEDREILEDPKMATDSGAPKDSKTSTASKKVSIYRGRSLLELQTALYKAALVRPPLREISAKLYEEWNLAIGEIYEVRIIPAQRDMHRLMLSVITQRIKRISEKSVTKLPRWVERFPRVMKRERVGTLERTRLGPDVDSGILQRKINWFDITPFLALTDKAEVVRYYKICA